MNRWALGLAALGFIALALWLDNQGYQRAKAECEAAAAEQTRRIEELRREIETRWIRDADQIEVRDKELSDAIAATDEAAAADPDGDVVCLRREWIELLNNVR